jgi:hypothetical protein
MELRYFNLLGLQPVGRKKCHADAQSLRPLSFLLETNGHFSAAERWGLQPRPDMRVFKRERLQDLKVHLHRYRSRHN